MLEITAPFQTMKSIQELSTPALLINSAHRNISLEDLQGPAKLASVLLLLQSRFLKENESWTFTLKGTILNETTRCLVSKNDSKPL